MQRLILMRHAKSDWSGEGMADFDRPLTKRGRKTAPRMAKWLRMQRLVPDLLVSSPAMRARQTTELIVGKLGMRKKQIVWDKRIYEAAVPALQEVIDAHRDRAKKTMLLVGHNPGFDDLLVHLCAEPPPRDARARLLTTAAVAVLVFGAGISAAARSAKLEQLVRPGEMDEQ
jgi:phosphohistidine phosphatase